MHLRNLVVALALACPAVVVAQAPNPPATTPAATQTARHELAVPPGFKVIDVAGRRVVAEPADEAWVRKAMQDLAPATRPTTAPADLVEKLKATRAEVAKAMTADLGLADPAKAEASLDKMVASAEAFRDIRPPIYYFATSRGKLLALAKGGWEDPRFYYNKAADEVMINTGMRLSVDSPMDDMLLPALFLDDAPADSRAAILARIVQGTERMIADEIARRAQVGMQVAFITFAIDEVFRPMGLKTGQDWLGVGVSGFLSAKYTAKVTGASQAGILEQMTAESPRVPIKAAGVDLIHPTDLNVLREQAIPFYLDAVRRKSTAAAMYWLEKAGPDALPKVLAAMRKQLPPDGEGLIDLIKRETGVDLTEHVKVAK